MEEDKNKPLQSPNSQHPIPQNFMDVEFKIIGDLTMRQFVYLCAFGGPAYLVFNDSLLSPFFKWPIFGVLAGLTFILVAVPIDDRGADEWIVNFIRAVFGPNERVWMKTPVIPKALSMESIKFIQAGWIATTTTTNRRKVEEYLGKIEEEEFAMDRDDFNFKQRSFVEGVKPLSVLLSEQQPQRLGATPPASVVAPTSTLPVTPEMETPSKEEKAFEEVVLFNPFAKPKEEKKEFIPEVKVIPTEPKIPQTTVVTKPKAEVSDYEDTFRTTSSLVPGRKFVSFSQKEAEELILPIKGERSINIFDETPISVPKTPSRDIKEITSELKEITKEAKKEYGLLETAPPTSEVIVDKKIFGTVTNEQNQPLSKTNLELTKKDGSLEIMTQTDELGNFNFFTSSLGEMQLNIKNPELYGLKFDIINFEVKSYPHHSFSIVGRK